MGNPVRRSYTALDSGPQQPINLDWLPLAQTTVAVWLEASAEYSIEVTLDDVNDPDVTPRWFTLEEFPVMTTASKYAAIFNPWLFLRLNIGLTTGGIELKVQQAFNTGNRY